MTTQTIDAAAVKEMLKVSGALLTGHFLLSSGLHSPEYLQCALVLADPRRSEALGAALSRLADKKPDLVLAPALGGIIIGHEVARALGVRAFFVERASGTMSLRRGFSLKPGEKVIVVEDVVTTGKSTGEVVAIARASGAKVLGALAVVDRSEGPLGFDLKSLMKASIPTYKPEDCPLCSEGKPLVKPGSRPTPR